MHIHVGNNMPGYLPDSEPFCMDDQDDAIQFLRSELRSLQDDYYESCALESDFVYDHENPVECECRWCDVASDIEAHLSHIADGYGSYELHEHGEVLCYVYPPEGADLVFWVRVLSEHEGSQADCELSEEW